MKPLQAWPGVVAWLLTTGPVDAFRPVLHEYLAPDAREDLELATTTADGKLSSVLSTNAGLVAAPDTRSEPNAREPVYAQPWARDPASSSYQADRNTGKPDSVPYADPFTPSIAPYKRLEAYDSVLPDGRLSVRERATERVPTTGVARAAEDVFYGDLTVDFTSGRPVRIPSVAAGARILRLSSVPAATVTALRDGADNLYVQSDQRAARVRLLFEMAAPKAAFASPRRLPSWKDLGKPSLPPGLAREAAQVVQTIGIDSHLSPDDALAAMVAYFRSFVPSDERPARQRSLYLDLALSRKGVCRHRAYAFTVTALGLGIPTRMVLNEAHAWVEVRQGSIWHRIDLGGAANRIAFDAGNRPAYRSPPDAYAWPPQAERSSGPQALAGASGASAGAGASGAGAGAMQGGSAGASGAGAGAMQGGSAGASGAGAGAMQGGSAGASGAGAGAMQGGSAGASGAVQGAGVSRAGGLGGGTRTFGARDELASPRSGSEIGVPVTAQSPSFVAWSEQQARRGGPIHIRGSLPSRGSGCPGARVQIALEPKLGGPRVPLGYLVTTPTGAFAGTLYLPRAMQAGDYDLAATALDAANGDCAE